MLQKKYEIVKEIAVAPADVNGWSLQLNLISWNENAPRYDLRAWSKERERMSKGKTLSTEELMWLKKCTGRDGYLNGWGKLKWTALWYM